MNAIIIFIQKAIAQGIVILFGATGEILTEKSGNLNLGVPGMMYMGGIGGLVSAFLYENHAANPNGLIAVLLSFVCAFLCAALGGLIYSVLTISLRANQNVTGLALTTFGVGLGNFFGGSLSQLAGGVGQIALPVTSAAYTAKIPVLSNLGVVGEIFFSYGFLTYLSIALALFVTWFLQKSRSGLNLRAVGRHIIGTPERPRMAVFRSNNHMYVQIIDDVAQTTLVSASTLQKDVKEKLEKTNDVAAAAYLGTVIAKKAQEAGIKSVVFDRGGFIYQGKIQALADAAREAGLEF